MNKRKSGLGRGLDALIPVPGGSGGSQMPEPAGAAVPGVLEVPVSAIRPNPRQPRSRIDPTELDELADSIRQHGVIQPLILTAGFQIGEYVLIAGERRLQAAVKAGLETVPAIVRQAGQQDLLELALIENVQRADLNPVEMAVAYRQLAEEFGLSHDQIAQRVGKSRVAVSNTLRLLNVSMPVLQAVVDRKISEGHARALLGLEHSQAQSAALKTVLQNGLTVRQTEDLVRKLNGRPGPAALKPQKQEEIKTLEEELRTRFGTRVEIQQKNERGSIRLHFYSTEELNALLDRLMGEA